MPLYAACHRLPCLTRVRTYLYRISPITRAIAHIPTPAGEGRHPRAAYIFSLPYSQTQNMDPQDSAKRRAYCRVGYIRLSKKRKKGVTRGPTTTAPQCTAVNGVTKYMLDLHCEPILTVRIPADMACSSPSCRSQHRSFYRRKYISFLYQSTMLSTKPSLRLKTFLRKKGQQLS